MDGAYGLRGFCTSSNKMHYHLDLHLYPFETHKPHYSCILAWSISSTSSGRNSSGVSSLVTSNSHAKGGSKEKHPVGFEYLQKRLPSLSGQPVDTLRVPAAPQGQGVPGSVVEEHNPGASVGLSSRTGRKEGKRSVFQTACDGNLMVIRYLSFLQDVRRGNVS